MADELEVVVAGGSIGGLAAAHALRSIGAQVTVFERSPGQMQTRGAGVVMQPEVEYLLDALGSSARAVSVPLMRRRRLNREGEARTYDAPQLMTSWDALYRVFRNTLAPDSYHLGSKLIEVEEAGGSLLNRFANGTSVSSDITVGADGIGSVARISAGISGAPRYAGYVAWRGLEPESRFPEHLLLALRDAFTMFAVPGIQFLTYLVPGPNGETEPGHRRVNWVWYMNLALDVLRHALESRNGTRYRTFLPPGQLIDATERSLLDTARQLLPTTLADLVSMSTVFMQPVYDVPLTQMRAGRVLLVGDAAGTVRPHTASGTSKAVGDALSLAHVLDGWKSGAPAPLEQLDLWERERGQHLQSVAGMGIQLAQRSALGVPRAPQFLEDL